jgi:hypothetical protein
MNQIQIAEQLKDVPDQYLMQEVQQPTGNYPAYLVVSELTRRKRMRQSVAEPAPTTTVAEDLAMGSQQPPMPPQMSQMPPQMPQQAPMGIAGLPQAQGDLAAMDAGVVPEERVMGMAGGGMVAFKQGGEVEKYAVSTGSNTIQELTPEQISQLPFGERLRYLQGLSQQKDRSAEARAAVYGGLKEFGGSVADVASSLRRDLLEKTGATIPPLLAMPQTGLTPAPQAVNPPAEMVVNGSPVAKTAYNLAATGRLAQEKAAASQAAAQNRGGGGTRVAPPQPFQSPQKSNMDAMVEKYLGTAPLTEEQLEARRASGMERYGEVMPDRVSPMIEQEIASRQERLGKEKSSNLNTALMQAGLAIMGNRSPYGMQAIGQGGLEGLKVYREGKKDIEQGEADLTKARIAAAQAKSLYEQGKYAAGDKAMERANDLEAKGLAKQQSDIAMLAQMRDREIAETKLPYELESLKADVRYKDAIGAAAGQRSAATNKLTDADQKAAEDNAKTRALMTPGVKFGTPEYQQVFNVYYAEELKRRAAGVYYDPLAGTPATTGGVPRFLGFE